MLAGGAARVVFVGAGAVFGEADGIKGGGDEADAADAGDDDAGHVEGGGGSDPRDEAADDDQRE